MSLFPEQLELIDQAMLVEIRGTVDEVRGLAVRAVDLPAPIGAVVRIESPASVVHGEVVGFDQHQTIVMPLGLISGVSRGDRVIVESFAGEVCVGEALLGRVLDGLGRPIDGKGPLRALGRRPISAPVLDPMDRPLIEEPMGVGVRAVDAMTTIGRGQRIGVFASPGLGKSTLLGTMARHTQADINVITLVGERGREVRDFIENVLGPEGLARSVVICATGDEPALVRIRCAIVGTAIAEHFRDQGNDVLLIMDSVTRFAQAQRQVGLAAGEPPATKGFPPSVFSMLPQLLERSGRTTKGSITGLYAVLVEGEELDDPIAESARGILDGHILLSRKLANRGHWPAIDVLGSISRVANEVTDPEHQQAVRTVQRVVTFYNDVEDLLNIGAYAAGSNPDFDLAIAAKPVVDQFLQQSRNEPSVGDFARTRKQLIALAKQIEQTRQTLAAQQRRPGAAQPRRS